MPNSRFHHRQESGGGLTSISRHAIGCEVFLGVPSGAGRDPKPDDRSDHERNREPAQEHDGNHQGPTHDSIVGHDCRRRLDPNGLLLAPQHLDPRTRRGGVPVALDVREGFSRFGLGRHSLLGTLTRRLLQTLVKC